MSVMLVEILFWSIVFVGLYLLLKRLQNRQKARQKEQEDRRSGLARRDDEDT